MPERNRMTPIGDLLAIPPPGAWTGKRGILPLRAGYPIQIDPAAR